MESSFYERVQHVPVTNLPDIVTESTAELTFTTMLAVSRRIIECDNYVRYHNDQNWHPFLFTGHELFGKKLGIIGMGRIGQAVSRRAISFGMHIYYNDTKPNNKLPLEAQYLSLKKLISKVDYLTLHVPYLNSTHHSIGEHDFELMKDSVFIVNVSRGTIVDQIALIKALKSKQVKGSALEFFETEPRVPKELTGLNNVVLTSHVGTNTFETNYKMALEVSKKLFRYSKA